MALLPVCTVPAESARSVGPLAPASGTLFGTYVQPRTGWNREDVVAAVNKLESDLGRRLDVDQHYYPWHVPFPSWKEEWDVANGRIPLITWGSIRTTRINSGSQDALIRARADGVKALRGDGRGLPCPPDRLTVALHRRLATGPVDLRLPRGDECGLGMVSDGVGFHGRGRAKVLPGRRIRRLAVRRRIQLGPG
jgi:hypothetical protein